MIEGVATTIPFYLRLMDEPVYRQHAVDHVHRAVGVGRIGVDDTAEHNRDARLATRRQIAAAADVRRSPRWLLALAPVPAEPEEDRCRWGVGERRHAPQALQALWRAGCHPSRPGRGDRARIESDRMPAAERRARRLVDGGGLCQGEIDA
jgi:hypothetical protein